jgi:hypothetical protein
MSNSLVIKSEIWTMHLSDFLVNIADPYTEEHGITLDVLRLDRIHPIVSGNKYFKLKYYIEDAIDKGMKEVATFGGPFSNHLHATAYATMEKGLHSIGYIRGYPPIELNDTLKDCIECGMELNFVPGNEFNNLQHKLIDHPPVNTYIIPMGGYGPIGMMGAKEILSFKEAEEYDCIVAASGTGTMAAGLLSSLKETQQLILLSSVKNNYSLEEEIMALDRSLALKRSQLKIVFDYHLGGFAKWNNALIEQMNKFYAFHKIPTDFVYTGKMIYGFYQLLINNFFNRGKKILLIHSGGLQGNRSLKKGTLHFSTLE